MEKYIKSLLATDSRAIIPNLGTIQALRDDNEVSLSFNPYLNFNDGKLTKAIADGEGLSTDEANDRIKSFVDSAIDKMNNGEKVTIAGIGSLFRAESGSTTEFEADSNYTEETAAAPSPISFDEPQLATEETKQENTEENSSSETQKDSPFVPETPGASTESYTYEEEKKSSKWPWILLVVLLLLVGLGLLLFVFNKDNAVYKFVFREKIRTEQLAAEAKAKAAAKAKADAEAKAKAKAEAAEKAKAEEEAEKAKKAFDPGSAQKLTKRYNIIVGSYKTESAAASKVSDLRAKGFDEAFVGYRKNLFVAVIGAFSSIAAAEKMQEQIVDGPYHIESWITNSGE